MSRKKRILWHSDPATAASGFGCYTKYILSHLHKTGKYEIANFACGLPSNSSDIDRVPWKVYPSIPLNKPDVIQRANQDPNFGRALSYGEHELEDVVRDFKPDIYITAQDYWGGPDFASGKRFWNKIPCIAHWTADSLPLLDSAVEKAPLIEHHLVWSSFAEKEYQRLADELEKQIPLAPEEHIKQKLRDRVASYRRVKTMSGCVNENSFYRLSSEKRVALREKFGLDKDAFIVSTGSRNQLRKLFPQQIEGFGIFQRQNPQVKAKLIFYTNVNEGWAILKSCQEYGVNPADVLVAYRCRATGEMFLLPPRTGDFDNPKTGHQNSVRSVGLDNFAPESAINDFLNLSDAFVLCVTSGGFELFLSQAKLTEIPVLANSYSCFEEQVGLDKGCLEVDQNFTYEMGTQFKKAAVFPYSIAKQLKRVYEWDEAKRREVGRAGRDFVLKNYSIDVVAKKWEELVDSFPLTDYDFNTEEKPKNPNATITPFADNSLWIKHLYKEILDSEVKDDDSGKLYWENSLRQGMKREDVEAYFRKVAAEHNQKLVKPVPFESLLDNEGKENRILVAMPKSMGDVILLTSLFKSLKELYPTKNLYVATEPQYACILEGNPYVHRWIPFTQQMENFVMMEGADRHKGYFDCFFMPFVGTQRIPQYTHNGKDICGLEIK